MTERGIDQILLIEGYGFVHVLQGDIAEQQVAGEIEELERVVDLFEFPEVGDGSPDEIGEARVIRVKGRPFVEHPAEREAEGVRQAAQSGKSRVECAAFTFPKMGSLDRGQCCKGFLSPAARLAKPMDILSDNLAKHILSPRSRMIKQGVVAAQVCRYLDKGCRLVCPRINAGAFLLVPFFAPFKVAAKNE